MSVYTRVERAELDAFLSRYPVGRLVGYEGISAGIENTNYFVDTTDGRWVLTLFERARTTDLPYFLGLMDHLSRRGIPCASPALSVTGELLLQLKGKPAALVHRLDGRSIMEPDVMHCRQVGAMLARMHKAGASFREQRQPDHGPQWCQQRYDRLRPELDAGTCEIISEELELSHSLDRSLLPAAVVHADLFRDNVLFDEGEVSGLIDFYYAANDVLLYDLAVLVNDWCRLDHGFDNTRYQAVIEGYCSVRNLEPNECEAWRGLLREAALRFWLSRLYDTHFPRDGELTHTKDPGEFRDILMWHRDHDSLGLT